MSGILPADPVTGLIVGAGDIVAQTHAVLANVKAIIEASGSHLGKVIKCSVSYFDTCWIMRGL